MSKESEQQSSHEMILMADANETFPYRQGEVVQAVNEEFIESRAQEVINSLNRKGPEAERVRTLTHAFYAGLDKAMNPGDQFSVETFRPADEGNSPFFFEQTESGLVFKRESSDFSQISIKDQ